MLTVWCCVCLDHCATGGSPVCEPWVPLLFLKVFLMMVVKVLAVTEGFGGCELVMSKSPKTNLAHKHTPFTVQAVLRDLEPQPPPPPTVRAEWFDSGTWSFAFDTL